MENSLDIKNSKEVLIFAFSLGMTIKEAKKNDGKIDMLDMPLLMSVIPTIGPAFEDISIVPKELKDLSIAEAQELQDIIIEKFGALVEKEKLVDQINLGLKAVISIYEFVKSLK